jgi:methionyl-tRNA formyltransferase
VKVHVATSRDIGRRCIQWASANLPAGAALTDDPEASDVFVSVLYAHLVSEAFIEGRKCFNFHPGILPQYRGAGAFSWCIINGDRECGVTLHELDVDIDTGPVIASRTFPVEAWDTAGTLHGKGEEAIFGLFREYFPRLLSGDYEATPQRGAARTYYRRDLRAAMDLTRFVRAFTFEGKEPAYYTDRNGDRVELRW